MVILSEDSSESTKKRINDKCRFYNVDIREIKIKETLRRLNLEENIKIITINDINFKKLINNQLKGET